MVLSLYFFLFLKKEFIYLFLQRGEEEGEREREKYQCVIVSPVPLTGDLASSLGMCPDWELKR